MPKPYLSIPKILATLISPFSSKREVQQTVNELLQNEEKKELLVELANRHFLIPTIRHALEEHQLLEQLDDDFNAYLDAMSNFMSERNQAITSQCIEFLNKAQKKDLNPLLLKGASTLFNHVYPTPGLRLLSDLDIVFKETEFGKAKVLFHDMGYTTPEQYQTQQVTDKSHHLPPLYREGDACPVELHLQPIQTQYQHYLTIDQAFEQPQTLSHDNVTAPFLALSPENEIIHCFVHSQLVDKHDAFDRMNFRHMDYFVRMVEHYGPALDWQRIQQHFKKPNDQRAFQQYIFTINTLFNCNVPIEISKSTQAVQQRVYISTLKSCFTEHYPLWQLKNVIKDLSKAFSHSRLEHNYEITNRKTLWQARLKRFVELIQQYHQPKKLMQRINLSRW